VIPPTVDLSTLAPMDVAGRLPRLRERLGEAGCDALLVTNLANVRYLTGFTGSAALLLVLPDELVLATDGRYQFQSAEQLAAAGVDARIEIGNAAG
jgi:Xaa-Pro aminopeptidase